MSSLSATAKEHNVLHTPLKTNLITSDPDVLGGTPVFAGTRVPVETLFDYLAGGDPLDVFLDDFPTVDRAKALAVLAASIESLIAQVAPTQAE
jgi:uncharacterized protein (DUF433 family)